MASSWDILSGEIAPGESVLLWDDAGDHAGLQAAEVIAETGARLEILNRERSIASEVMGMNLTPYLGVLQALDVTFTPAHILEAVTRKGNALECRLGSDYTDVPKTRRVDQVVNNNGVLPLDDIYFELKPLSRNKGRVDYAALLEGRPSRQATTGRARSSCIASAMRCRREMSTPRSTTPSG